MVRELIEEAQFYTKLRSLSEVGTGTTFQIQVKETFLKRHRSEQN